MSIVNGIHEYAVKVHFRDGSNSVYYYQDVDNAMIIFNMWLKNYLHPEYAINLVLKVELIKIANDRMMISTDYYNRIKM